MPLGHNTMGAGSVGASSYSANALPPSFSVKIVDRDGNPIPQGTAIQAAWFDQNQPQNFTDPSWKGNLSVSDTAGTVTAQLTNSILSPGGVGWLVISSSNGDPQTIHSAFSGPVTVV